MCAARRYRGAAAPTRAAPAARLPAAAAAAAAAAGGRGRAAATARRARPARAGSRVRREGDVSGGVRPQRLARPRRSPP
ncbi:hypothetical protein EF913_09590 [Streptomyces sp. WAC04189]|nr:hypothetical protein EF913_09590 [Streptomyces sp. WAC04189]